MRVVYECAPEHFVMVSFTGEWPYTIAKLMGKQALCNAHGKRHFQLRKAMGPAFSAEAVVAYIPRMVQIAETLCEKWADSKQVKGKMIFKDFTFQVGCHQVLANVTSNHSCVTAGLVRSTRACK